jgi:hypothetical protein
LFIICRLQNCGKISRKLGLGPSEITDPCTAALVTSLARAALSAALLGIERYNKGKSRKDEITVISATTDGLLIGVPIPKHFSENYTLRTDYFEDDNGRPKLLKNEVGDQLSNILKRFEHEKLLDEINAFLPIRQMKYSRRTMTDNDEIFEIKHLADKITSIKTRGQIGKLDSGDTTLLARSNLKPPLSEVYADDPERYKEIMDTGGVLKDTEDAIWIEGRLNAINNEMNDIEEPPFIEEYTFITLVTFPEMLKCKMSNLDLTKKTAIRKINTDYDWKRKIVWPEDQNSDLKTSPFSVPHINTHAMITCRNVVSSIRAGGKVARPEDVLTKLETKGKATNSRGGKPLSVTRLFLRGIPIALS